MGTKTLDSDQARRRPAQLSTSSPSSPSSQQPRQPRRGETKESVGGFWSLSPSNSPPRVEPPWLRDKRRQRESPQTNPLGGSNPFDTSSCSSNSSLGGRPGHANHFNEDTPPATRKHGKSNNPFDTSTEVSSTEIIERKTKINVNPFDNSIEESEEDEAESPDRGNNPFDTSTDTEGGNFSPVPTQKVSKVVVSPFLKRKDSKSVGMDSLDQILNQTDETQTLSSEDQGTRLVTPMSFSVSELSHDDTTVSDSALRAAEALRRSFSSPRKTPSPSYKSSAMEKRLARRTPPPTIPETPPNYNVRQHTSMSAFETPPVSASAGLRKNVSWSPRHSDSQNSTPQQQNPQIRRPSQPVDLDKSLNTTDTSYDDAPSPVHQQQLNLALHDLCDEALTTDDIAWRNALFLLSVQPHLASQVEPESQMTPLHVCALALEPPPVWMTRGLLYTFPQQCQHPDSGGRLPLHLLAATSAHVPTMQLFVDEYPASVSHRDSRGFTPLQLLLKNDQIVMTLQHLRILLGQTVKREEPTQRRISFRKGQHLNQTIDDLEVIRRRRRQEEKHEAGFAGCPEDVQHCIRKITQWKRRQIHKGLLEQPVTPTPNLDFPPSPASIPTPTGKLLPLHLLARRPPQPPSNTVTSTPPASQTDLVRVLVADYPEALISRDANGRTPLMIAMVQSESIPSDEVLELLLGLRTAGYNTLEKSPAQFPTGDTHQLPLHVAAEEWAFNFRILSLIYEAHPSARLVQDIRGRTPLHLALQNYRGVSLDPSVLELLFAEPVAKMRDNDGNTPLDLVVANPKRLKECDVGNTSVIQEFLDASIDKPNHWRDSQDLLRKLRILPPWLRRHSCAAKFVQETLMKEMTSPWSTFLIFLSGLALVGLLLVLRHALDSTRDEDTWILVNYFSSYLLATQLVVWATTYMLGEFYRLVLSNPFRWVDLAAGTLSIGTAYLVSVDIEALHDKLGVFSDFIPAEQNELVANVGAAATAAIWISILGYLMQWWCGVAVFVGSSFQLLKTLLWPLALAFMGIAAMSQVLYTLEDCAGASGICTVSDAYTTVYLMILGEPVIVADDDGYEGLSRSMTALLIVFTVLWIWWIVSVMATTVSEAYQLDRHDIALKWFWEPKVALTILAGGRSNITDPPSCTQAYCDGMERLWHVLVSSIKGGHGKKDVHWNACCFRPSMIILTRLLAVIVLPVWFLLGLVTLGAFWPPQVRCWIFATGTVRFRREQQVEERLTAAKLSNLKADLLKFQNTSHHQSQQLQHDIAQIKELLFRAMSEEGS